MNRKWIGFLLAAGMTVAFGIGARLSLADDKETPLGKIMEKVQKNNNLIAKATRTPVAYKKGGPEIVEKAAKDLAKLAKEAKPFNDAVKKAKGVDNPQKRWDELMDDFAKTSTALADAAAKQGAQQKDVKDAFNTLKKSCADCHKDFRIEEAF